jgi:hypothetical protein
MEDGPALFRVQVGEEFLRRRIRFARGNALCSAIIADTTVDQIEEIHFPPLTADIIAHPYTVPHPRAKGMKEGRSLRADPLL